MKQKIMNVLSDTMTNMLYYNRKEDAELPVGSIGKALREGVVTIDEMVKEFKDCLKGEMEYGVDE